MQIVSPVKVIAACSGLSGFAVAMLAGLSADNPADVILSRAVASLFVCYLVGGAIGFVMEQAVAEGVRDYKVEKPLPMDEAVVPGETRAAG